MFPCGFATQVAAEYEALGADPAALESYLDDLERTHIIDGIDTFDG